jgi:RES domain-containing protein
VAVPSVVSRHSWNLVFDAGRGGGYALHGQERFALDPRLHPAEP